jgi:hypothetical protein
MIQSLADSAGVTTTCIQAFRLHDPSDPGRLPRGLITCCEGRCKVKAGGTLRQCETGGCLTNDGRCTSLTCSGSCVVEVNCRPCKKSILFPF